MYVCVNVCIEGKGCLTVIVGYRLGKQNSNPGQS